MKEISLHQTVKVVLVPASFCFGLIFQSVVEPNRENNLTWCKCKLSSTTGWQGYGWDGDHGPVQPLHFSTISYLPLWARPRIQFEVTTYIFWTIVFAFSYLLISGILCSDWRLIFMEYMQLHSDWRTCAFLKMLWLVERIYGLCSSVFRMQCISSNNCVLYIQVRTHSFIQHGLRFLLRNLLRNPRLSAQQPAWAEKCKYGAIVQLCQKWL